MNRTMPRSWLTGWLMLIAGLLACSTVALAADRPSQQISKAETRQIRAVIQSQLDALAADDAKRAFSYASPGIQKMVGSPDNFIDMVRTSYPVVYRPASVVFLAPQWAEGTLVQPVQMTDTGGALWLALYTMERQADKSWRISGCTVRANEGRAT